jgi:hypothetical protein
MELKVARNFGGRAAPSSDQLLALVSRYEEITGREARGWLLIVLAGRSQGRARMDGTRAQIDELLVGLGRSTIVHSSELSDIPDRFRQLFEV